VAAEEKSTAANVTHIAGDLISIPLWPVSFRPKFSRFAAQEKRKTLFMILHGLQIFFAGSDQTS
jgi:hypothetical protein